MKVGQYTNCGWVVATWKPNHDKPVTLTEKAAYACWNEGDEIRWYWASEVQPVETDAVLPRVGIGERIIRRALVEFLADYGGNAWVARQVRITKPGVIYILGNRLWPPYSVLKRELRASGGSYLAVARRLNTTVGNLRRVEAVALGKSDRTYGGVPVNPRPTFHKRK